MSPPIMEGLPMSTAHHPLSDLHTLSKHSRAMQRRSMELLSRQEAQQLEQTTQQTTQQTTTYHQESHRTEQTQQTQQTQQHHIVAQRRSLETLDSTLHDQHVQLSQMQEHLAQLQQMNTIQRMRSAQSLQAAMAAASITQSPKQWANTAAAAASQQHDSDDFFTEVGKGVSLGTLATKWLNTSTTHLVTAHDETSGSNAGSAGRMPAQVSRQGAVKGKPSRKQQPRRAASNETLRFDQGPPSPPMSS
ncbi:hypothetical protein BC831DRAFT_452539 [Entophlyctis helioformis]|nr:hypothetical protein BC831DRAFT_452539 [Entophlyctis helioformis]